MFTNKDEANTPLERPGTLQNRDAREFDENALASLAKERQAQARKIAPGIGGSETGAGPTHWYEHLEAKGSRPWLIVDPADGRLPAFTPQAEHGKPNTHSQRCAQRRRRADSTDDRTCTIAASHAAPGSMMRPSTATPTDCADPRLRAFDTNIHETRSSRSTPSACGKNMTCTWAMPEPRDGTRSSWKRRTSPTGALRLQQPDNSERLKLWSAHTRGPNSWHGR